MTSIRSYLLYNRIYPEKKERVMIDIDGTLYHARRKKKEIERDHLNFKSRRLKYYD